MWSRRAVWAVSVITLTAVTAIGGCGRSTRQQDGDEAGEGGRDGAGGSAPKPGSAPTSAGGSNDSGGTGSLPEAGSAAGGATPAGEGGAAVCVSDGACDCAGGGSSLGCAGEGSTCSCLPPECQSALVDCFEPCGGDPFGNWVLEDGCFPGGELAEDCEGGSIRATIAQRSLRIRLADFGVLEVSGSEDWDLAATAPASCLTGANDPSCGVGVAWATPLLFSAGRALLAECADNACGSCDCFGTASSPASKRGSWSQDGMRLTIGAVEVPYCVDGDILWMGGHVRYGVTKVAYKFRKQSCTTNALPCEQRSPAECTSTGECRLGRCLPTGGDATKCNGMSDFQCEAPDCTWVVDLCSPTGLQSCPFTSCEDTPGCSLGPPVARCTGDAWCGGTAKAECTEPGCSIRTCVNSSVEPSCESLYLDVCARAPGCSVVGESCTGTTRCAAQTDDEVCELIGCTAQEQCWGVPGRTCSDLSVEECHTLPGCEIQW